MKRIALIAALLASTLAAPADAKTTQWYTLDVGTNTFLTAAPGDEITLSVYRSGDTAQQWAPVYREWPYSPTTSADAAGAWRCITFCGYTRPEEPGERKFVNRATGKCMVMRDRIVFLNKCAGSGPRMLEGVFQWGFYRDELGSAGVPVRRTRLGQGRNSAFRCLQPSNAPIRFYGLACGGAQQGFRFLRAATVECNASGPSFQCGTRAAL